MTKATVKETQFFTFEKRIEETGSRVGVVLRSIKVILGNTAKKADNNP